MRTKFLLCLSICLLCLFLSTQTTQAASATFAWDKSASPEVTGYKLYAGVASGVYGAPIDVGNVLQYTITNIPEGVNLFYVVTARDSAGNESAYSTELKAFSLTPIAPVNGTITPNKVVITDYNLDRTFLITPNTGYRLTGIKIDGNLVAAASSYTFSKTIACHTIEAVFSKIITLLPPQNMKITP